MRIWRAKGPFGMRKIESHYVRLKVMELGQEMANSSTMNSLLRKFPLDVKKEWVEFLGTVEEKERKRQGEV